MENYNPFEGIAQIKAWVDESFLKIAPPDEATERYRDIGKAIDQLNKLGISVPEDLVEEKESLEKLFDTPNEEKRQLASLAQELSSLANQIKGGLRRPEGPKTPHRKLKVTFPDGTVICENKAVDTFVRSLQLIGLERIAELPFIRNSRTPLVSFERTERPQYRQVDGYFILTHTSTEQKAKGIERIAAELRIDIVVEIEDK